MDFNFAGIAKKSAKTIFGFAKRGFRETGEAGLAINDLLVNIQKGKATQQDLYDLLINIQSGEFQKKIRVPEKTFKEWYPERPDIYEPRLKGASPQVKPYIFQILNEANKRGYDFRLRETKRAPERQAQLVKEGKSKTYRSRHLTGDAFDLVRFISGKPTYQEENYLPLRDILQDLNIPLQQGIITKTKEGKEHWWDRGHIQMPSEKGIYGGFKDWKRLLFPQAEAEITKTTLSSEEEKQFQKDYTTFATQMGLNPNPDDPQHYYNYRRLWKEEGGFNPDKEGHLPSKYKLPGHPTYEKKFDLQSLNPLHIGEAEASQTSFNFMNIPKQTEQLYLPPEFKTEPFTKIATPEEFYKRETEIEKMVEEIPEGVRGIGAMLGISRKWLRIQGQKRRGEIHELIYPYEKKEALQGVQFLGNVVNELFWRPLTGWYQSMLKEISHREYKREDYISGKAGFQSLPRAMARGLLGIEDVEGREILEAGGIPKTEDLIIDHPALAAGKEIWGATLDVLPLPIMRPLGTINRMLREGKYVAADKLAGEVSETIARTRYGQMGNPLGRTWEELPQQTKNVAMKMVGESPIRQFGNKSIAQMFYEHPYRSWAIEARRGLVGRAGVARLPFKVGQKVTLKGEPFNIANIKGTGLKALIQLSKGKVWQQGEPVVRASEIDIPYKPVAKEPWQMTSAEYDKYILKTKGFTPAPGSHEGYVSDALAEGEVVPTKVLEEYPDLAKLAVVVEKPAEIPLAKGDTVVDKEGVTLTVRAVTKTGVVLDTKISKKYPEGTVYPSKAEFEKNFTPTEAPLPEIPEPKAVTLPPTKITALVSQAMEKKPTLPALGNIHIDGNKIYATDLDHSITYTSDKKIGKIGLPAELLAGKNIEDIQVIGKNKAKIETLEIQGSPPEESPKLPSLGKEVKSFSTSAPDLTFELARAIKFASTDETRYILNGVKLEVTPKNIRLVSTDGRRLFLIDLPSATKQKFDVILPTKAIKSLIKVMNATGEPITNIRVGKEIEFEVGKFKVQSRLIEGEFPKYKQVIPEKTDMLYLIAKDDLISVIKECPKELITAESMGIDFSIKENKLTFTKKTEVGKFTKTIPILKTDKKGELRLITLAMETEAPYTIDIHYLADALKTIQSDEIVFGLFKKPTYEKPFVFYEPKEISRVLAKSPALRVPSIKTTPSVRRGARTTEEETISGPEAAYAQDQVATKEELARAKQMSDNDYRNVVLVKLRRLSDIAPDIVTKKQIGLAYALANKKKLTKIQLHKIEKLITDKTSLAVYTKGGRIRKRVLYKHEARDLIKGLHQLFVKPYAKAVIPRKVKTPKDLERISTDVTELPLQRVQAARMIRQWRRIIPPELQPKTISGWFDFAESMRGVGYERLAPTRYWMEKYERVTKVPIYSKIYLPFEMAERELNKFKIAYKRRINEAFGDLIKDEAARKNVKFYLSDVEEPMTVDFTLKTFDAKGEWIEVPAKLTDEELEIAKKLRPILRELFTVFDISNYWTAYMPRIKQAGGIRLAYPRGNIPNELRFFAELERTGILSPQEDDALKLLYIYINAGAKKLFYQPVLAEARAIRKILNSSADRAVSNYIKEKLGFGRRGEQLAAITADNILRSVKLDVSTDLADTFRQLYFSTTYGSALGFRVMPVARNYCQPFLLTLPEVGPKYFARGMRKTYSAGGIKEPREGGWLLDWGVPFYEEIERYIEGGKIATALRAYNKFAKSGLYIYARVIDAQNRAITYHAVKERFMDNLRLLQRGQINPEGFFRGIDLGALDPTLQGEVRRLVGGGAYRDAMNLQIRDIIDATQYPYRPGTEAAVGVPYGRYATQFLVWPTEYAHTIFRRWLMRRQWKKLILALASAYALKKSVERSTKFITGKAISVSKWVMLGPLSRAPISPVVQFAIQVGTLLRSIGWRNKETIDRNIQDIIRSLPIGIPYGLVGQDLLDFHKARKNDWKIYNDQGRLIYQSSPTEELFRLFSFTPVELEQRRRQWQEMANLDYAVGEMRKKIIRLFVEGKSKEAERLNDEMLKKYQDAYLEYGILLKRVGAKDAIREIKWRELPKVERMRKFMPGRKLKGYRIEGIPKARPSKRTGKFNFEGIGAKQSR